MGLPGRREATSTPTTANAPDIVVNVRKKPALGEGMSHWPESFRPQATTVPSAFSVPGWQTPHCVRCGCGAGGGKPWHWPQRGAPSVPVSQPMVPLKP